MEVCTNIKNNICPDKFKYVTQIIANPVWNTVSCSAELFTYTALHLWTSVKFSLHNKCHQKHHKPVSHDIHTCDVNFTIFVSGIKSACMSYLSSTQAPYECSISTAEGECCNDKSDKS